MLPHPHPILSNIAPCIRMRQKAAFLILTTTKKEPKPKNQTAPKSKREVRRFKHPHPHKENKTDQHKTNPSQNKATNQESKIEGEF